MAKKKSWKELTPAQRVSTIILTVLQFALLAAALWDLQQRSDEQVLGDKSLWRAVVFINFIGPLAYFFFGRKG